MLSYYTSSGYTKCWSANNNDLSSSYLIFNSLFIFALVSSIDSCNLSSSIFSYDYLFSKFSDNYLLIVSSISSSSFSYFALNVKLSLYLLFIFLSLSSLKSGFYGKLFYLFWLLISNFYSLSGSFDDLYSFIFVLSSSKLFFKICFSILNSLSDSTFYICLFKLSV